MGIITVEWVARYLLTAEVWAEVGWLAAGDTAGPHAVGYASALAEGERRLRAAVGGSA